MGKIDRLPAIPIIANDPYFSYWVGADTLDGADTMHWAGEPKPILGWIVVDGKPYGYLGKANGHRMETVELKVLPTRTISVTEAAGIRLTFTAWSPALPDDLDVLSTPITFFDYSVESTDGKEHQVELFLHASDALCYEGYVPPQMITDSFETDGITMAYTGQAIQKPLCHSGDHITIDWGYLYIAAENNCNAQNGVNWKFAATVSDKPVTTYCLLGYDDIASINYFGVCCRAWYMRNGKTLPQAMQEFYTGHDALLAKCIALDEQVMTEADKVGGEAYVNIVCAAWRHTFAAHKLIATPSGEMSLLSKENDSNGCIGTVDVSYPSIPLFLRYCPELVNALCRHVLEFAVMPVWKYDFAPHDVGRYPYATGQVYACKARAKNGETNKPYFLYPASADVYDHKYQMPVEECGNMLIMLESAVQFGAGEDLIRKYAPVLDTWVKYLDTYGEDPGEQLCTDDFAGHLARNINLSAKALVGVECYARILRRLGRDEEAAKWDGRAREMAKSWYDRASVGDYTSLTFDGNGWSMKYNLVWDKVLDLGLLPDEFYQKELRSYLPHVNMYSLPLDSRADYTKSDWILWTASMADDREVFDALVKPVARYLRETRTRVPFSDWYDTVTGDYVHFIARSVQGGVFMPLIAFKA